METRHRTRPAAPVPARRVAHLDGPARRLRHEIATWGLATGTPVDFDALTVVLAAKAEMPAPLRRWTEEDVWRLWWIDLSAWCSRHGIHPPARLAATLRTVFAHLESVSGFGEGSDGAEDLAAALDAAGGAGPRVRRPASVS